MQNSRGFFKVIGIIVVALVVLSFLGFNIDKIITAPALRNFFLAIWDLVVYLFSLVTQVITFIFVKVFSIFR